jgi:hypothetical protein
MTFAAGLLLVVGSIAEFVLGMAVGRRLPRRGRHSRPRRPWARRRWDALTSARGAHPTAHDDIVVIDLRAWIPVEEAYDPIALRAALVGHSTSPS